jgi:GDPmannose 4,6-dehydratase
MQKKTALITGITGQDGAYLAEFLLAKGYRVVGLWRKTSAVSPNNVSHLQNDIELVYGDLLDSACLVEVVQQYQPDELYNFASQSYPGESWRLAMQTVEINGLGAHRIFDAVKQVKPACRVYQASSSEMFGRVKEVPQNEQTPFNPVNPYAAAKLYAHNMASIYRESFGLFIACGILFNHESPRRGMHFITQKVTHGAACIKLGLRNSPILNEMGEPIVKEGKLSMGNLQAQRDWGFAGDYVEAMWLMLQQPEPDDTVIGTGRTWTIQQLCEKAFAYVGLDWQAYVVVDTRFTRPTETGPMVADASRARRTLGWQPKTSFDQLIAMMVDAHLTHLAR